MDTNKKREFWTTTETHQMLLIIRKRYISKLVNSANTRNLKIFEEIAKEMEKHGINRNAIQIRMKFKTLKLDYMKLIGNSKSSCSEPARRQTKQHLKLLNEIFANKNEPPIITEGDEADEMEADTPDPLLVTYHHPEIKTEKYAEVETKQETELIVEDSTDDDHILHERTTTTPIQIEHEKQQQTSTSQVRTFKQQKRENYHNVVEKFSKEWKNSQYTLLQTMEEQDHNYLRTIEAQCKRQEELLREDRREIERILKEDREEMKSFFTTILQTIGQQSIPTAGVNNLFNETFVKSNSSP